MNKDLMTIPIWVSKELLTLRRECPEAYYHAEIIEFSKWIRISEDEFALRLKVFEEVKQLLCKEIPNTEVYMFGSTASRLALAGSDIDVLVINKTQDFIYDKCVKLLTES